MNAHHSVGTKHYAIGAIIITLAFLIQPFTLLFVQSRLAPVLAQKLLNQNQDGTPVVVGKEIPANDLKVRGNPSAQIMLVEYSDYECPFCARFHDTPKEIVNASNGKVAWAWKFFPLTQIHPHARPAAIAGECVNKLGGTEKFWLFSDSMIANQDKLSDALYRSEAVKLGINGPAFDTCIKDPAVAAVVDENTKEGEDLGVNGTPSTFVVKNENGKLTILENISGALPKDTVENIIKKYSE